MKLSFTSVSKGLLFACCGLVLAGSAFLGGPGAFNLGAMPAPQGQTMRMTCSSDDMRRHFCAVDTLGGVWMVHQKSEAKCIQDRTWGYDNRGIWVDRGCRAEFEIGAVQSRGGEGGFRGWGESYFIYCPSEDMGRQWCPADSRFGVRLIRQRSEAPCIQDRTWGYGKRGIWVDRGCRADFQVTGDWQQKAADFVYCASDYMQRAACPVDTRDGVFIVRQRSEADCLFKKTWGYERDVIWVDRGCRADFEIVDYRLAEWREWRDRDDRRDYARDRDRDRDDRRYDRRDDRPPY